MFSGRNCKVEGCLRYALEEDDVCLHHHPDNDNVLKDLLKTLSDTNRHVDIVLTDVHIKDVDFSNAYFVTCDFARCTFENVNFSNARVQACFFDYSLFINCNLTNSDARHSVLAGSKLINCDFTNSLMLHSNMMGLDATNCNFSSSDLYRSNFSCSYLVDSLFVDCNMTGADFRFSVRKNVSFKYSNYEEALF
ncbi:MAG: pentapeptide repeat-containing protein [Sphaerochaetaceae bacterium]|jgi:uncharacterized protein YjbI with pentapeptide repeats